MYDSLVGIGKRPVGMQEFPVETDEQRDFIEKQCDWITE